MNSVLQVSESNSVGPIALIHAASMFSPGAIISGLRIFESKPFNPLTENEATISAGLIPSKVPWKSMEINKEALGIRIRLPIFFFLELWGCESVAILVLIWY